MVEETKDKGKEQKLDGQPAKHVEGAALEAASGMTDLINTQKKDALKEKDPNRAPRPDITGKYGGLKLVDGVVTAIQHEDLHKETRSEVKDNKKETDEQAKAWEKEKATFGKEHGVKLLKNQQNGQLEYHVTLNGKDTLLCQSKDTAQGMQDAGKQLDKIVLEKEAELHKNYGVTFAQPGDKRSTPENKYSLRPGRMNELYALESALEHSKPTSFNGIKIEFVDDRIPGGGADQGRVLNGKYVGWDEHNGQQVLRITPYCGDNLPTGTTDKVNGKPAQDQSIEGYFIHELVHASESRWAGDKGVKVLPQPVYVTTEFEQQQNPKMGWTKSNPNDGSAPAWLLQGKDGYLYKHDDEIGGGTWTRVNKEGEPLKADGQKAGLDEPFQYESNADMRAQAKIRPSTEYFDTPAEEYAEALMHYRMNAQGQQTLLAGSPELYKIVKETDQEEINQKYGLDAHGNPKIIRGKDGRLVQFHH